MTAGEWIAAGAVLALVVGLVLVLAGRGMRQRRGLGEGQTVALDNVTLISERYGLTGRPDRLIREGGRDGADRGFSHAGTVPPVWYAGALRAGSALNHNPFDFIERNPVIGAVIELGGFWRFMCGDLLGVLDGAAVFQVGGDAGGPEGMAACCVGQPGGLGTAFHHVEGVTSSEGLAGELAGFSGGGAEEGSFIFLGDARCRQVGIEVAFGVMMGGHFVEFAAFLMQP